MGTQILGKRAVGKLLETRTENAGHYILIAYRRAAAGCWEELAKVTALAGAMDIRKAFGLA